MSKPTWSMQLSSVKSWLELEERRLLQIIELMSPLVEKSYLVDEHDTKRAKEKIEEIFHGSLFRKGIRHITTEEYRSFKSLLASLQGLGCADSEFEDLFQEAGIRERTLKEGLVAIENRIIANLISPQGKVSTLLRQELPDWKNLERVFMATREDCFVIIRAIQHIESEILKRESALSHYDIYDALLLIHPDCDIDSGNPGYLNSLSLVCRYFYKKKKPIFRMDDAKFDDDRVEKILEETHCYGMLALFREKGVKKSDNDERFYSMFCSIILDILQKHGIKKKPEDVHIAIGGRYPADCVYAYTRPLFTHYQTHYPGREKHKRVQWGVLGYGTVIDEIV